jgi:polyribonucleotide nucleotidyltransferase
MFNITRKGGRGLVLEAGKIARQADGAVMVAYGGTTVLCTVVAEKAPKTGIDFLPLTVHYIERAYAAGRKSCPRALSTGRSGRCSHPASTTRSR